MNDERFPKSQLAFGTGSLMGRRGPRESAALLRVALDHGIRHFDTARMYGRGEAEALLGRVVGHRDDVSIATKIGKGPATRSVLKAAGYAVARPLAGIAGKVRGRPAASDGPLPPGRPGNFDPAYLKASVETSRRLLRRSSLDCVLLHELTVADVTDQLEETLQVLVATGRVQRFGIATDRDRLRAIAAGGRMVGSVIQQPGGPLHDLVPITASHVPIRYSLFGSQGRSLTRFLDWLAEHPAESEVVADAAGGLRGRAGAARAVIAYAHLAEPEATFILSSSSPARIASSSQDFADGLPSATTEPLTAVFERFRADLEADSAGETS